MGCCGLSSQDQSVSVYWGQLQKVWGMENSLMDGVLNPSGHAICNLYRLNITQVRTKPRTLQLHAWVQLGASMHSKRHERVACLSVIGCHGELTEEEGGEAKTDCIQPYVRGV